MKIVKKTAKTLISIIFWVAIWFIATQIVGYEIILPSPVSVVKSFAILLCTSEFYLSCLYSLLRILSGLCLGVIIGITTATLTYKVRIANMLISPMLSVVRSTPVATFILLLLLWSGRNFTPAVTSMLMVIPVIWNSTTVGLKNIPNDLLEVASVYKYTRLEKFKYIIAPSVSTSLLSGFKTSIGLAWKSGIAAEVICSPKLSIGGEMYDSKVYLETSDLFAWTLSVIILSFIFEKIFDLINNKIIKKYNIKYENN